MKTFARAVVVSAIGYVASGSRSRSEVFLAVAPAPAPAPGPAAPGLNAISLKFEIDNYNYLDLDQALDVPHPKKATGGKEGSGETVEEEVRGWLGNTGHGAERYAEAVSGDVSSSSLNVVGASHATTSSVKGASGKHHKKHKITVDRVHGGVKQAVSFEQLGQAGVFLEPLVRDVLRDTVSDTVEEIVEEYLSHQLVIGSSTSVNHVLSTAPSTNGTSLLAAAPAAAPGPAPAAPVHKVDVFVQFSPGHTRLLSDAVGESLLQKSYPNNYHYDDTQHADNGKTTMVEVTITGVPETGKDELPAVEKALQEAKKNGDLNLWLSAAMNDVSGLIPKLENFSVGMAKVTQWSTKKCEAHMAKVIGMFVTAYTRRMVPTAIFNECTRFDVLMSFSHDYIPNKMDIKKCRDATIKFSKKWNFGGAHHSDKKAYDQSLQAKVWGTASASAPAAASPAAAPAAAGAEFGDFCVDVCEAKYGEGAQQCHVTEGDQLLDKKP